MHAFLSNQLDKGFVRFNHVEVDYDHARGHNPQENRSKDREGKGINEVGQLIGMDGRERARSNVNKW